MENQLNTPEMQTGTLSISDITQIGTIHCAAFPASALTKLGAEAVRRYYEWLLVGPHDAVNIGAFDGVTLVGFCFGGVFRGAMGGFLERNRSFLVGRVLTHPWLLMNPIFRQRATFAVKRAFRWNRVRNPPQAKPSAQLKRQPSFGILSIAVHPDYQGTGAAQLMMEYSEHAAIERGFQRMGLTVHPNNARAVRFYEKMGWKRENRGSEWAGSMSKAVGGSTSFHTTTAEVAAS